MRIQESGNNPYPFDPRSPELSPSGAVGYDFVVVSADYGTLDYTIIFSPSSTTPLRLIKKYGLSAMELNPEYVRELKAHKDTPLKAYEILFAATKPNTVEPIFDMLNFSEPEIPIRIMATVRAAVTDFLSRFIDKYDAISFKAKMADHGRVKSYDTFSAIIAKHLKFHRLAGPTNMDGKPVMDYTIYDPTAL